MIRLAAEWRKIENTVSDGPGQERTEASYVFGAEYDGVFVPAITKSAGYFEHLHERAQADAERKADDEAAAGPTPSATRTTQTKSGS